jgi:membrane protein required for beta-lactamase induction
VAPAPPQSPAPAPLSPATHAVRTAPARRGLLARTFEGRRGQLRLLAVVGVVASLAFAVLGAMAFADRRSALADARAQAAQLVRVQSIQIALARADALATNAFLAQGTGVPPADLVKQYEDAVSEASRRIADAARAQPADGPSLARVNDQLTDYTGRIATAWAVRQDPQTPTLATGYLGLASQTLLREGMLRTLDDVTKADATRVDDAFAASARAGRQLLLAGAGVVVVLLLVGLRLALLSKRYVNVPLLGAAALVAVFTIVGGLVMAAVQSRSDEVRRTSYAATRALADARVAAYRAKADESITLIRQNFTLTPTGYQDPATENVNRVNQQLQAAGRAGAALTPANPLAAWSAVHKAVIEAVNGGQIEKAKDLATGPATTAGTSNQAFTVFEQATREELDQQSAAVSSDLGGAGWLLLVLAALAILVGLLAAAGSWFGLSQRLEEYR